jgi:predicted enzyme related to lactoylglutathione lyase
MSKLNHKIIAMQKIIGIGGIFIKARDPKKLAAWYEQILGIQFGDSTYTSFAPGDISKSNSGQTVFSFFKESSDYFQPSTKEFMINLRVEDLRSFASQLATAGVSLLAEIQEYDYGLFAWIMDPEGNKIELWEEKA